ncbi:MAG: ParM/StbA family protein [Anaerolineales bacterium]|nr:ParM/StbA family protein [Anaerolineales bacterium]
MTTSSSTHLLLGQDLGMGSNKLFGAQGGFVLPSTVAAETTQPVGRLLGLRSQKPPMHIRVDGLAFYVGSGAHDWGRPIENLDYDRLTGVPETRAIVYANFTRYFRQHGLPDIPLHLIVGLPLEPLSGSDASANANAVRQWLRGEHQWEADGHAMKVTIAEVKITSQPSGALFDYLLDDQGQSIAERKAHFAKEIGIISVGFNTLELMTVRDKAPVQSMTAGQTLGVRRLLEIVNREGLYTLGELDSLLRAGKLDLQSELQVWGREVTGQIEKVWGQRWRRFSQIIVVGGGALLLRNVLVGHFGGKLYIPDDPILSIARGLYRLAVQQAQRRER